MEEFKENYIELHRIAMKPRVFTSKEIIELFIN